MASSAGGGDWQVDGADLRRIQQPLKQSYRDDAGAALVTLTASSTLGEDVSCSIDTGHALVRAGLHPATGGDGTLACSGDLLLQALAACAGVTLSAVSTALGVAVNAGRIEVEGDLDFRGTLGVSRDAPVGFREIRLRLVVDTEASDDELAKVVELTERYCVVLHSLAGPVTVEAMRQPAAEQLSC
jgi:uncharacterized OsmC-like protein